MAKLKGSKARAAALVLVALVSVLGLPTQAALAQDAGFDLNTELEITNFGPGGDATLTSTISPVAGAGGVTIGFENASTGETGIADAACFIPAGGTQCVLPSVGGALGATVVGNHEIVSWVEQAGCTQDRFVCSALPSELQNEAASPGARAEVDDTDVVTVNVDASTVTILDCSPDSQLVNLGAPAGVNCTQRDQNGVTTTFPVDVEFLSGPADPTPGQQTPVDDNDPNFLTPYTVAGSGTPGVTLVCFFVDGNKVTNDLGAEGPLASDGGDCAAEAANPSADDNDSTDVVCIVHGSGTCPGSVVIPPIPPVLLVPPVISGEGCADGSDTVSFRINWGQEIEDALPGTIGDFFDLLFPPTTLSVAADDPDGGATTLSLSGAPGWLRLEPAVPSGDPVVALIVGEPSLLDALALLPTLTTGFTLVATDNEGQTDTCVFVAVVGPGIEIPGPLGS